MKNTIITLLLSTLVLTATAQNYTEKEFKTIKEFLIKFQENSKNKVELLKLIEPLQIGKHNTAELIVEKVLEANENGNADFAYSDEAMRKLQAEYINNFKPLTEELKTDLYKNDEFHKIISKYTNEQIAMFDHKEAHILLILDGKETKLLFWEKLNSLLK